MTHADAGHYAAKHPQGTRLNTAIAEEITKRVADNHLSCAAAHAIADGVGVSPAEVGRNMDLMEIRLSKCQLGLFGYSPEKKCVTPADDVSPDLAAAIRGAVTNGRLPCQSAWQIAAQNGIKRMAVSAACEALAVKVKPCQLGAF
ncbi:MAG: hypothetical protein QNJ22_12170 [Desulfosarcinaceae bacterium]|nr:hypothetical protein [Desulfosarcinaceae bacterium]